jgi:hypothetical protein
MSDTPRIKRVYFVGAGFSVGLGYPTGGGLIPMLMRHLCGYDGGGAPLSDTHPLSRKSCAPEALAAVRQGMEQVLRECFRVQANFCEVDSAEEIDSRLAHVDLSEFFTVLLGFSRRNAPFVNRRFEWDRLRLAAGDVGLPATLYDALASVVRSCFYRIASSSFSHLRRKSFQSLFANVDAGSHAIVNYNWDEAIDYFLDIQTQGFAYTHREWLDYSDPETGKDLYLLLKPHGSIGWYDVGQGLSNDNLQFVAIGDSRVPREHRRLVYYSDNELPKDLDGRKHHPLNCPPSITPPTYAKSFECDELRLIWQDVIDVCSNADEFVFLGYSLPSDDFWTRAAIRMALANRGPKKARAMLVSRSWNPILERNYRSVFGEGFEESRNFLAWNFGDNEGRDLGYELEQRMKRAAV